MCTAVPTRLAATAHHTRNGDAMSIAGAFDSDPQPGQLATYRKYLRLQSIAAERFSGTLAGHLVLCVGFGMRGAELALATTMSGGVFLGIDPDPHQLKAAVRDGSCDFMVNALDEALRVLKNELRKRTPLSVGLLGVASDILTAMVERSVQPNLIADTSPREAPEDNYRSAIIRIVERGAEMLADPPMPEGLAPSEVIWTAASQQDLRRMDHFALELIPPEDRIRRRWLEQAGGCFHRHVPLERVVCLHPEERTHFLDTLKSANASYAFQAPATVRWQDAEDMHTVTL